jgi:hypothetical protein
MNNGNDQRDLLRLVAKKQKANAIQKTVVQIGP